ncbi:hypothetical protein TRAPUB_6824 [Trametes pubescens]|uniref:Uncharacterized protein n=1 Tax=Trametes pubescens TaxID=154538 RepID=A0A1M2V506_TRAPU|nr:hypothetical protein TRAPUB_6824 [Trametes pubescens]
MYPRSTCRIRKVPNELVSVGEVWKAAKASMGERRRYIRKAHVDQWRPKGNAFREAQQSLQYYALDAWYIWVFGSNGLKEMTAFK